MISIIATTLGPMTMSIMVGLVEFLLLSELSVAKMIHTWSIGVIKRADINIGDMVAMFHIIFKHTCSCGLIFNNGNCKI